MHISKSCGRWPRSTSLTTLSGTLLTSRTPTSRWRLPRSSKFSGASSERMSCLIAPHRRPASPSSSTACRTFGGDALARSSFDEAPPRFGSSGISAWHGPRISLTCPWQESRGFRRSIAPWRPARAARENSNAGSPALKFKCVEGARPPLGGRGGGGPRVVLPDSQVTITCPQSISPSPDQGSLRRFSIYMNGS